MSSTASCTQRETCTSHTEGARARLLRKHKKRRWRLARGSAAEELSAFLVRERAAIVRAWQRELRAAALLPSDFDTALAPLVDELAHMLVTASDPAPVFAERLAGRGAARFRQQARLRDV